MNLVRGEFSARGGVAVIAGTYASEVDTVSDGDRIAAEDAYVDALVAQNGEAVPFARNAFESSRD